ncbi:TPA: hypothetical protein I8V91_002113 [Corynebacterium striatum]|nr:hypothetical protein [Corynebacterium striatum]HAT1254314.1 hypothetical protein [Corynebacterium striatum]HAT1266557.1 hypothetical protein [Corynebacterium striatum]HAT1313584.1 hypothetical protein [Corynebacterium striatum]HAT1318917.1 hypothetical protein [Corynebacterium striatum]
MASKTAILSVRIISDAKKAVAGFKEATGGLDKLESGLKKVQPAATVAAGAVIALGKQAVDSASSLQQSTGAVESVFKAQATAIKELAADAAGAVGLSANQYQEFASVIGSQLKNLGTAQEDLVPTTDKLITMGADLASMFGGTTAEAVESLSAAFRGEYDPIEKYGISIKKSDINARLAAKGLSGLEGEALRQAEAQELLAMLTEQSADAVGNFQRETDTAAGSAQIAAANWENAKAALGQSLLPVVTQVAEKLAGLAQVVGQHPQLFGAAALAIVGVAGAINGALLAIKAYAAAQSVIAGVKAAWAALNTSMAVTRATMVAGNAAAAAQSAAAWVASAARTAAAWVASAARMAVAWTVSTARMVAQLAIQRGAMLAARAATLAMAAGQAILNAVMTANPIGIVIVAIAALVAALVLAYNKSETFRNAVQTAARASKAAFDVVVNVIRAVIAAIGNMISRVGGVGGAFRGAMNIAAAAVRILTAPIRGLISLIQSVIGWISRIRFPSPPGWMRKLTGSAMSFSAGGGAMLTAAGPASFSPLGGVLAPAASGPANVDARTIINVNITDSAVGDERHLADVVTRAIRKTDVQLGRKKVFK